MQDLLLINERLTASSWSFLILYIFPTLDSRSADGVVLIHYPVNYHSCKNQGKITIRIPEKGTRPLFRLIAYETYCHVNQNATEYERNQQVKVTHGMHCEKN